MSKTLKVNNDVSQLYLTAVNAFLISTEDGLLLVDTGWTDNTKQLFDLINKTGHDPLNIKHIILTHGHIDHAGSAADIRKLTQARIYAHKDDIDLYGTGLADRPGTKATPGFLTRLIYFSYQLMLLFGKSKYEPFSIDQTVEDNDTIPLAGGIEVLHTPGHSKGHIALLLKKYDLLIAGDLCANNFGIGYSILHEYINLAKRSIARVLNYPFENVVFGHGNPVIGNANKLMRERFSNEK